MTRAELQPGEVEIGRYGKWRAIIRRTDHHHFDKDYTLWWWRTGHDDAGDLDRGRGRTLDEAADQAVAALDRWTRPEKEKAE